MLPLLLIALLSLCSVQSLVPSRQLPLKSRLLATKRVFNLEIPLGAGYKPAQAKLR